MSFLPQPPRDGATDQSAAAGDEHAPPASTRSGLLRRALASGSLASVLSTVVVSVWSRHVAGSVPAGTNAASQWVWDRPARHARGWSWRHTAVGYLIHHASSVFWATGYEGWCARRPARPLAKAAAVAALAYLVDYHVVPRRLSPGFERRISAPGMACAYAGFALGLAIARAIGRNAHRSAPPGPQAGPPLRQPGQHAQPQRREHDRQPKRR